VIQHYFFSRSVLVLVRDSNRDTTLFLFKISACACP
jgi:hypothetical protein